MLAKNPLIAEVFAADGLGQARTAILIDLEGSQGIDDIVLGWQIFPARLVHFERARANVAFQDAAIGGIRRCQHGVGDIGCSPFTGPRLIFIVQKSGAGLSTEAVDFRLGLRLQVAQAKVEEFEAQPARRDMMLAAKLDRRGKFAINLREAEFFTAGDDGIGEILPQDSQQIAVDAIFLSFKRDREGDAEGIVTTPGQPFDFGHVAGADGHHGFAVEPEAGRQQGIELSRFAQEAQRIDA